MTDSVETIGGQAFYNCASLEIINISENVTSMGKAVFQSCDALEKVTIPKKGTAVITVKANGIILKCKVNVK